MKIMTKGERRWKIERKICSIQLSRIYDNISAKLRKIVFGKIVMMKMVTILILTVEVVKRVTVLTTTNRIQEKGEYIKYERVRVRVTE